MTVKKMTNKLGDKRRISNRTEIWTACEECGKERWVRLIKGEPTARRCHPCAGKLTRIGDSIRENCPILAVLDDKSKEIETCLNCPLDKCIEDDTYESQQGD